MTELANTRQDAALRRMCSGLVRLMQSHAERAREMSEEAEQAQFITVDFEREWVAVTENLSLHLVELHRRIAECSDARADTIEAAEQNAETLRSIIADRQALSQRLLFARRQGSHF